PSPAHRCRRATTREAGPSGYLSSAAAGIRTGRAPGGARVRAGAGAGAGAADRGQPYGRSRRQLRRTARAPAGAGGLAKPDVKQSGVVFGGFGRPRQLGSDHWSQNDLGAFEGLAVDATAEIIQPELSYRHARWWLVAYVDNKAVEV